MTRPLELMVDIDDVIFPTMVSIHDLAEQAGLHDGTGKMAWSGWESYELPDGTPCPPQVYWDLWSEFAALGGYLDTEPIPGAIEALRFAMWEGHNIHLVTARGFMNHAEDIRAWTLQWVANFAVPHKTLTFAKDKVQAMHDLGVTFDSAIDDSPSNYGKLDTAGVEVYLQDHPHNENFEVPPERRVPTLWEWIYRLEKRFTP